MNICTSFWVNMCSQLSWVYIPRSVIVGSYNFMFNFLRNCHNFPNRLQHLTFPLAMCEGFNFFTFLQILLLYIFFVTAILVSVRWYFMMVLIYISLMTNDDEHLFMCLLSIYISSLRNVYQVFYPLFNWVVCCWVVVLDIFCILDPYLIHDLHIFSRRLFFHFLVNVLWCREVLILMKSNSPVNRDSFTYF